MGIFRFTIEGQQLRLDTKDIVVADSVNYLEASFIFSPDWAGLTKYAHFANNNKLYDILLESDGISASMGLNLTKGTWSVYVHGEIVKDEEVTKRIITIPVIFKVQRSGEKIDGEPFPTITASVGEQIIAKATAQAGIATDQAEVATNKASEANDYAEAAQSSAEAANASVETARALAEAAQTSAGNAQTSAEDAQTYADNAQTYGKAASEKATEAARSAEEAKEAAKKFVPYDDTEIRQKIVDEQAAREQADTNLQQKLTDEQTARINADTEINQKISDEATARIEANTEINQKITDEQTARVEADTTIQQKITDESAARTQADTDINQKILDEQAAREAADTALNESLTQIDSKKADADNVYTISDADAKFITKAVSDLANYYLKSATYTKAEVNSLVSAIPKFAISVVSALPTTDISTTTIYLLKTSETETGNLYTEYIYVNNTWESLGTQTLDLSGYMLREQLWDAGIKSCTWSVIKSEITVETTEDIYKSQRPSGTDTRYWGEFEECPEFLPETTYRVTFNGTVYDNLICGYGITTYNSTTLLGNRHLYDSRYENTGVPFCILYISSGNSNKRTSYYYSDTVGNGALLTSTAGSYSIFIEKADITQKDLPKSLLNNYKTCEESVPVYGNILTGKYSSAIGDSNVCSGLSSICVGSANVASGTCSYAEGNSTTSSSSASHAEGISSVASGFASHAEGYGSTASGFCSHAEGGLAVASGTQSHAEGEQTIAASQYQHVQGKYNISDADKKYAHIVGNGTSKSARSNAHTLDWSGNAWFAGTVEGTDVIIKSPDGTRWKLSVNNDGILTTTKMEE